MCPLWILLLPPSLEQGRDKGAPEAARGTALGTPAQCAESSQRAGDSKASQLQEPQVQCPIKSLLCRRR